MQSKALLKSFSSAIHDPLFPSKVVSELRYYDICNLKTTNANPTGQLTALWNPTELRGP